MYKQPFVLEIEVEEKTSHYVQLDDGSYAEMVEGHELVGPGHQMLVEDQDGQKLVVVNPAPGEEPQTIVVPEQAETVYVIGEWVVHADQLIILLDTYIRNIKRCCD